MGRGRGAAVASRAFGYTRCPYFCSVCFQNLEISMTLFIYLYIGFFVLIRQRNRGGIIRNGRGGGMTNTRGGTGRGRGRGQSGGRGRGRGRKPAVDKSADELDQELENYHAMQT